MVEEANLGDKSDSELVALHEECTRLVESFAHSASERMRQSEAAGWDNGLREEAFALWAKAATQWAEANLVATELERRYGPLAPYGDEHPRIGKPVHLDQRWHRENLTTRTVPPTHSIDEMLPEALENLLSRVPRSWWLDQQSLVSDEQRNAVLQPLLLCGRERWPMGFPALHKFANYLVVADDNIRKEPYLDTYTAARAIPQICSLGLSLEALQEVKGADAKLKELCQAPGTETDARIFELLVAASFARKGHDVAFIEETPQTKTPDLRLYDVPVPVVIECKRRQPLTGYERKEFSVMRELFARLCAERKELGLVGELAITFTQEMVDLPPAEIAEVVRDVSKSLSPYADKETEWGSVHLRPVDVSHKFEPTRLYSPDYLERVFGTDLELDEFDGICAVAENILFPVVEQAELPFLLKWTSDSPVAKQRKLQTVKSLWIQAVEQIPTGEMGLIYLAYEEGHRPSLADARTNAIRELASTIYFKRRSIVVPMTVISRLYPNVVLEGRPDFIESTIPLPDGEWDDFSFWIQELPTRVFAFQPFFGRLVEGSAIGGGASTAVRVAGGSV